MTQQVTPQLVRSPARLEKVAIILSLLCSPANRDVEHVDSADASTLLTRTQSHSMVAPRILTFLCQSPLTRMCSAFYSAACTAHALGTHCYRHPATPDLVPTNHQPLLLSGFVGHPLITDPSLGANEMLKKLLIPVAQLDNLDHCTKACRSSNTLGMQVCAPHFILHASAGSQ